MIYRNRDNWNIRDQRVLDAMDAVPRELFVRDEDVSRAGDDNPLSIGLGQTVSQPYIVAAMTEALDLHEHHRVLEIGTGSGFQTAVLYQLSHNIFTVERITELAAGAERRFQRLGYAGIRTRVGDGKNGWTEEAPFDRIIVTAAPPEIPETLLRQLSPGGRMIIPVGHSRTVQTLTLVTREADRSLHTKDLMAVSFVPLV